MQGLIIFIIGIAILYWIIFRKKQLVETPMQLPTNFNEILEKHVLFYQKLDAEQKFLFDEKVKNFLSTVRIHGVKTTIDITDKLLVAASAIIPIFYFKHWKYHNLRDVLIYDDLFNADNFKTTGEGRNIGGMVGTGTMNNMMILSKHELQQGFLNKTDKHNTAIHEFVHLLDKSDGAVDGIPENLLDKQEIIPWIKLMHRNIQEIQKNKSDINPYGATNEAEFFAVASEYFFERPELLQRKHPVLYEMLEEMFSQDNAVPSVLKS
jgi:Mlc titration factor MtfA (ptsG expression regulator)